ncbi:MAG: MscL family protein, partial [Thermoplasmata archaeon]
PYNRPLPDLRPKADVGRHPQIPAGMPGSGTEMGSVMEDLRAFITRGSAVDMAVGIVIGTAFTAVITSIVNGLLLPLISVPGHLNYGAWKFLVGGGLFLPGAVLTAIISFAVIALVIFFAVVRPIGAMEARRAKRAAPPPVTTRDCPECLASIPLAARRCMFCTEPVPPAPSPPRP